MYMEYMRVWYQKVYGSLEWTSRERAVLGQLFLCTQLLLYLLGRFWIVARCKTPLGGWGCIHVCCTHHNLLPWLNLVCAFLLVVRAVVFAWFWWLWRAHLSISFHIILSISQVDQCLWGLGSFPLWYCKVSFIKYPMHWCLYFLAVSVS